MGSVKIQEIEDFFDDNFREEFLQVNDDFNTDCDLMICDGELDWTLYIGQQGGPKVTFSFMYDVDGDRGFQTVLLLNSEMQSDYGKVFKDKKPALEHALKIKERIKEFLRGD